MAAAAAAGTSALHHSKPSTSKSAGGSRKKAREHADTNFNIYGYQAANGGTNTNTTGRIKEHTPSSKQSSVIVRRPVTGSITHGTPILNCEPADLSIKTRPASTSFPNNHHQQQQQLQQQQQQQHLSPHTKHRVSPIPVPTGIANVNGMVNHHHHQMFSGSHSSKHSSPGSKNTSPAPPSHHRHSQPANSILQPITAMSPTYLIPPGVATGIQHLPRQNHASVAPGYSTQPLNFTATPPHSRGPSSHRPTPSPAHLATPTHTPTPSHRPTPTHTPTPVHRLTPSHTHTPSLRSAPGPTSRRPTPSHTPTPVTRHTPSHTPTPDIFVNSVAMSLKPPTPVSEPNGGTRPTRSSDHPAPTSNNASDQYYTIKSFMDETVKMAYYETMNGVTTSTSSIAASEVNTPPTVVPPTSSPALLGVANKCDRPSHPDDSDTMSASSVSPGAPTETTTTTTTTTPTTSSSTTSPISATALTNIIANSTPNSSITATTSSSSPTPTSDTKTDRPYYPKGKKAWLQRYSDTPTEEVKVQTKSNISPISITTNSIPTPNISPATTPPTSQETKSNLTPTKKEIKIENDIKIEYDVKIENELKSPNETKDAVIENGIKVLF